MLTTDPQHKITARSRTSARAARRKLQRRPFLATVDPVPEARPAPAAFLCVACWRVIQAGQPMRAGPVHSYCTMKGGAS